ncbi:MAG: hypothetical protein AXA67_06705 [Methylothermaceae bacteria B42]|nr:MAG: hypothetical protein AXA67_06705 [Methylothermaceae bacteria B42]HHJ39770.1 porin [Methylothermaceae bacterium]
MPLKRSLLGLALISLGAQAADAPPDLETLYRLLQAQQRQLQQQQEEIATLRQQLDRLQPANSRKPRVKLSTKKGFVIKDRKTGSSLRLGGRVHIDQAFFHQDETSLGNGAKLRRARLFAAGGIGHDWRFKSEIEFGENGKVGPRNVWLAFRGWKPLKLTLGHFQEPFSLEGMTSSNAITFMERALPFAFTPDYHIGAAAAIHGERWTAAGGVFGDTLQNHNDNVDQGWGGAARVTFAPWTGQDHFLHLGLSGDYRQPDSQRRVRFRSRPESYVTNKRLVDTRTIARVDDTFKGVLEGAIGYGPLSLQGEYFQTWVKRRGQKTLNFSGWYAYGSWLLTGETRPYRPKSGNFGRINPRRRWGAWELGMRYSALDLSDSDVRGGRERNLTVGLNWYLFPNLRFMANYILADASPNRDGLNEHPRIFQLRGQVDF